ncbi:hypothetical protein WJ31_22705 [Burkholderia ubonensis]|nr:hypothetical protein WJ31_22705 [Burkholderia ubonensis]
MAVKFSEIRSAILFDEKSEEIVAGNGVLEFIIGRLCPGINDTDGIAGIIGEDAIADYILRVRERLSVYLKAVLTGKSSRK